VQPVPAVESKRYSGPDFAKIPRAVWIDRGEETIGTVVGAAYLKYGPNAIFPCWSREEEEGDTVCVLSHPVELGAAWIIDFVAEAVEVQHSILTPSQRETCA
jgi:hypothetical protein